MSVEKQNSATTFHNKGYKSIEEHQIVCENNPEFYLAIGELNSSRFLEILDNWRLVRKYVEGDWFKRFTDLKTLLYYKMLAIH